MSTETRNFRMHPKLLMDVIKRQAGSFSKAILEGVMNAVDAGAPEARITVTPTTATIVDHGRGFADREAVTRFFEVFGQPHDEGEQKVYGTFRMGRGQLFAFGRNTWRTDRWRMDVDVNTRGLDYDLIEVPADQTVQGCDIHIDLYEELWPSSLGETQRDIELWCKYAPIPVYYNDKRVNVDPEKEKWDHVLPEAYIRLRKSGSLTIYNLGIHVMDVSGYRYGTGGVIVSRQQLKVNFARNDVQSDCPVWKQIKPFVDTLATRRNRGSKMLSDEARERLCEQIRTGEITFEHNMRLKVITAVTGRHFDMEHLLWHTRQICVAPRGDRIGDRIMRTNQAFVLARETLERFGCRDLKSLFTLFKKRLPDYYREDLPKIVPFADLSKKISSRYQIIPEDELTSLEKVWKTLAYWLLGDIKVNEERIDREMQIGDGPAHGWTDGSSYIAIDRKYLKTLDLDLAGFTSLGLLLIHEACHHDPDNTSHDHDQAYYETFHDVCRECLPALVTQAMNNLPKLLEDENRRLTKAQLKQQDRLAKAARQKKRHQELTLQTA